LCGLFCLTKNNFMLVKLR